MLAALATTLLSPAMVVAQPSGRRGACTSDADCSLLGVCDKHFHRTGPLEPNYCDCDPGWKGDDCGQADLLPYRDGDGYINSSAASWGGRPVYDEASKTWHLFATEIAHRCPLILFMNDSSVIRAEADSPTGPYRRKETVLPPFHHNPTIIGPTPDGYFLIFSIGNTNTQDEQIPCEHAVPADCDRTHSFCRGSHMPNSNGRINMAYSKSIRGPWREKVILPYDADNNASAWNCENNNPTATVLANGTIFLVYRADPCKASAGGGAGGGESLGVATADHWSVRTALAAAASFLWFFTDTQASEQFVDIGTVCEASRCSDRVTKRWHWHARRPMYASRCTLLAPAAHDLALHCRFTALV
jgi:hypothetical protein